MQHKNVYMYYKVYILYNKENVKKDIPKLCVEEKNPHVTAIRQTDLPKLYRLAAIIKPYLTKK